MNPIKENYYKELETENHIVLFRVDDKGFFSGTSLVINKNNEHFQKQLDNVNILVS